MTSTSAPAMARGETDVPAGIDRINTQALLEQQHSRHSSTFRSTHHTAMTMDGDDLGMYDSTSGESFSMVKGFMFRFKVALVLLMFYFYYVLKPVFIRMGYNNDDEEVTSTTLGNSTSTTTPGQCEEKPQTYSRMSVTIMSMVLMLLVSLAFLPFCRQQSRVDIATEMSSLKLWLLNIVGAVLAFPNKVAVFFVLEYLTLSERAALQPTSLLFQMVFSCLLIPGASSKFSGVSWGIAVGICFVAATLLTYSESKEAEDECNSAKKMALGVTIQMVANIVTSISRCWNEMVMKKYGMHPLTFQLQVALVTMVLAAITMFAIPDEREIVLHSPNGFFEGWESGENVALVFTWPLGAFSNLWLVTRCDAIVATLVKNLGVFTTFFTDAMFFNSEPTATDLMIYATLIVLTMAWPFAKKIAVPKGAWVFDIEEGINGYQQRCRAAEPFISGVVDAVLKKHHGRFSLVDEAHKFKATDALVAAIEAERKKRAKLQVVKDGLRYRLVVPHDTYVQDCPVLLAKLMAAGDFELVSLTNNWLTRTHNKGIFAVLATKRDGPDMGVLFEVQLHTWESRALANCLAPVLNVARVSENKRDKLRAVGSVRGIERAADVANVPRSYSITKQAVKKEATQVRIVVVLSE